MRCLLQSLILSLFFVLLSACSQADSNSIEEKDSLALKSSTAEDVVSQVTYLGNEALMVEDSNKKILFDPFFHNTFNTYQAVPESIRIALFNGTAPYDNIDAIFVSHAHADHFSASDVELFLKRNTDAILIAPQQAIDNLGEISESLKARLHSINLEYKEEPLTKMVNDIRFDVVRIPHAGWPQRADVSNLVFRVSLSDEVTVVHMGDADPNDEHFKPLMTHWNKQDVNTAFPPYWFFMNESGQFILSDRIQAKENIGVHVPTLVPNDLKLTGEQYFSQPGETREFK